MTASPPLQPVPRGGPLPLSSQQERFWILQGVWGRTPALELPFALRLRGPIDADQLTAVLGEMVRRHEILRTVYSEEQGRPVQRVLPARSLELPCTDLASLDPAARDRAIADACARTHTSQIDLATSPLRFELLRTAVDEHLLFVTFHHIACDVWSKRLWHDELVERCTAVVAGRAAQLPAVPLQYGDYAVWQRSWLDGARIEDGVAFWRQRITPVPLVLPEALRGEEPSLFSHEWSSPEGFTDRLAEVARAERVAPSVVALAAFCALVQSWGNREALVAVPLANRQRPQLRLLQGLFMNIALVRVDLDAASSFRTLLQHVRDEMKGGSAHQDVPFFWAMPPGEAPPQRVFFNYFEAQIGPASSASPLSIDTPSLDGMQNARRHFTAEMNLEELPAGRLRGRLAVRAKSSEEGAARVLAEQYQAILDAGMRDLSLAGDVARRDHPREVGMRATDYVTVVRSIASKMQLLEGDDQLKVLDSLTLIELVAALEDATGRDLLETQLTAEMFRSVELISELLERTGSA